MKLRINYDFLEKIRNVNEPHNPLKVIRNNKNITAIYFCSNCMFQLYYFESFNELMLKTLYCCGSTFSVAFVACLVEILCKEDYYAKESSNDIKILVNSLNKLHMNINYELFLKFRLFRKEYKINLNEKFIP